MLNLIGNKMPGITSPFVIIMLVAALVCLLITVRVWPRRRENSETIPLVLLLLGILEWIAAALGGLLDLNLAHKMLWAKFEYIGVVSVPLAVLAFVLTHTGSPLQLTRKRLAGLALIPLVTLVLVWTNGMHGLIWAKYVPYVQNGLAYSQKTYGPAFWVYWVYSYLLLLAATLVTFRSTLASARLFRWQAILVGIGILAPWIGNLLYVLHLDPLKNLDLTPLGFSLTGILLALGMFHWRLFDIKPVARAAALAGMADGLILLDNQARIVDANLAAQAILGLHAHALIGKPFQQLIPAWQPPGVPVDRLTSRSLEVVLMHDSQNRVFELSDSPFYDRLGSPGGSIVFLHDVTNRKALEGKLRESERKQADALLQQSENRYAVLYQNMPVGVVYRDAGGQLLDMNPAAQRILGVSLAQLTDLESFQSTLKPVSEAGSELSPADYPGVFSLRTGQPLQNQVMGIYFPLENAYHWIEIDTVPQFRPGEQLPYQVFITFNDISARKQAGQEISRRLTDLNVLYESSLALSSLQDPQEIGRLVIRLLADYLDWHHAVVRLKDQAGSGLKIIGLSAPSVTPENYQSEIERLNGLISQVNQGMNGWVAEHGQVVLSNDLPSDPRYIQTYPGIHSGLYAPMLAGEEIIGVISIESEAANAFTEHDQRLLVTLSKITANAIHRARLNEQTAEQLQHLAALRSIDQVISTNFDLALTLEVTLKIAVDQLGAQAALVLLADPAARMLKYAAQVGFEHSSLRLINLRVGEGVAGQVARERRSIRFLNPQQAGKVFMHPEVSDSENFIACQAVPLVVKGQLKGILEIYLRSALVPDAEWMDFLENLAGQVAIAIDNNQLFENLQRSNFELTLAYDETIQGWAHALDLRDKETEGHSLRVTDLAVKFARLVGLTEDEIIQVRRGAWLHDIGKLGVPDSILRKPGPLTEAEWESMRKHPQYAYEMLQSISYLRAALDIPYCHHEKWDGTGYPRGLKGEEIPLSARLFALVDVWDVLTSDTLYRAAWTNAKALEYIQEQSGQQFDPNLLGIFLKNIARDASNQT
jgi:PAS domain S-box-containing protein